MREDFRDADLQTTKNHRELRQRLVSKMNLPASPSFISVFFLSRSVGSDKAKKMERDV